MAYAALVSLAQVIDQHFIDVLHGHQIIKSLNENIISLLTFLDNHHFPGEAGNLEARITVAANQAEDIIENHISDGLILSLDPNWQQKLYKALNKSFKKLDSIINKVVKSNRDPDQYRQQKLFRSLNKSLIEFDSILNQVNQIITGIKDPNRISAGSFPSRPAPTIGKEPVVGLDQDLIEIKERLCGEPSKLQIIPIVGMGGVGKTTLARYAYDDPLTLHHFDIRVWVVVSQENSARGVLLDILDSIYATKNKQYLDDELDDEDLEQGVYQNLKGRRYVIVMDDIWSTNVWDELRRVFPDDVNGSRIVVTTRLLEVASYVDSLSRPYEMHLMDIDRGWCLFKEKVFGQRENCPPGLEHIGRLIVENCRGLPLPIVVIAGVLSNADRTQESWANIAGNVKTVLKNNESDDRFSDVLSLSYAYLPHYLRPCFLYMGCFPEDHEINVPKLVKLWAAEGFLRPNGSNDLEELAEECLEDLVKRSLVLVSKRKYNGRLKSVMIHDLLRDVCMSKARDEKFVHVISEFPPSSGQGIIDQSSRRLSILVNILGGFRNTNTSPIHTILLFKHTAIDSWRSFKLLRVVDALNITMTSYPDTIFELIHLRYLAFTFQTYFSKILEYDVTESFSKLENLQTLIIRLSWIRGFNGTLNLPSRIWRMPQLRHLILWDGYLPDPSSRSVTSVVLENLHTLSRVRAFTCSHRMLEVIPNVQKLRIHYLWGDIYETGGWPSYCLINLVHLHKLEELNIDAEPFSDAEIHLTKNLVTFPLRLKKLTLRGCNIPWEDMTIIGSLPSLEVLKLKRNACHGLEWKTTEGEFSRLKVLLIDGTDLHQWVAECGHFPRLERLILYDCDKLREIPSCFGEIATLQVIEVDASNISVLESAKNIEDEQQSFGNDIRVLVLKSRASPMEALDEICSISTQDSSSHTRV